MMQGGMQPGQLPGPAWAAGPRPSTMMQAPMQRSVPPVAQVPPEPQRREMDPLLKQKIMKPRGVFNVGARLRMNVVPLFLNIFVPWGAFIFCSALLGLRFRYNYASFAYALFVAAIVVWLVTVYVAIRARKSEPDPTWFTYFAVMLGIGVFAGGHWGDMIYENYYRNYYEIKDLKVVGHLDVAKESGQNNMDAGIIYFAEGNKIDGTKSR